VVLVGALLLLQAFLPAQTAAGAARGQVPLRESAARGVVTDAASGRPLPRALVSVSLAAVPVDPVLTDAQGAFVITTPAGGTPRLRVSKAGYTPMLVPFGTWFSASNRLALARADGDGGFQVRGLPPGDYWIAVIAQPDVTVTNGEWRRSDALARLMPSGQRVTVTSHQTVSTTVRLVR
jgi:hypothetical protein